MVKRIMVLVLSAAMMMSLSGCFLFVAGVAGGAGTAYWLSGKLTQEFHGSYQQTIDAARKALTSMNMPINKETQETMVTQYRSTYSDGREVWIDIHRISDASTKVEVRVGAINSDKAAAGVLLKKIESSL